MIIDDLVEGFHARDQVIILQGLNKICEIAKKTLILINESYERDAILLQAIIDNKIEETELQAMVTQNIVKVEKGKSRKWKWAAILEGALIILLIITIK